ncbi:extracellular alkaline serine protease [Colletotrichum higginsianum]|nr:extracellular alkaline serine protease [Colletotrichum higginsianum]
MFWSLQYAEKGCPLITRKKWDNLLDVKRTSIPRLHTFISQAGPAAIRGDLSKTAAWFKELEDVELVLRTPKRIRISENYRPVRVAVIDTAVDPSRKVVAAYDFINKCVVSSDKDAGTQNFQHGTQSVDLILKVYDEAVIFVAKIFDGEHVDEKQGPLLMAEAITWAVSQSVDIISISAGFASCPEELRAAVHQAHAAGILIFAAASNWGNTNQVAFPARIQDQVFCIFATTAALKDVPEINPEPRKNADNFALLGHDIDLPGHTGLWDVSGDGIGSRVGSACD